MDQLAHHRILILGLGREGFSSYKFLRRELPENHLWVYDDQPVEKLGEEWRTAIASDSKLTALQNQPMTSDDELPTLIFKTPGLPPDHPFLQQARGKEIQLTSNTQLFFDLIAELKPHPITIGVTGTKGKSTTTSLIHQVLKENGLTAFLAGNIGVPPLDLIEELRAVPPGKPMYVALEMSSHQLLDLHTSPHLAVIQNIVPEHLDYYASFEDYVEAKSHITQFQTADDFVIFNPTFELPAKLAARSLGKQLTFATRPEKEHSTLAWVENDSIVYQGEPVMKLTEVPLPGSHNLENVLPSVIIGRHLQLTNDQIAKAITSFKPLEHRLEFVREVGGVSYYNDSLSTVQDAAVAALKAFSEKPVILIAGGYDRGLDFTDLAKAILAHPVKALILFRPTGERIAQTVHSLASGQPEPSIYFPRSMSEAVHQARQLAKPGDVVLMSPASPSFGEFKDYADRGQRFKREVTDLKNFEVLSRPVSSPLTTPDSAPN